MSDEIKKTRRIKQVYLSENGEEEKKVTMDVTTKSARNDEDDDTRIYDPKIHGERLRDRDYFLNPHETSHKRRGIRIAIVSLVLLVSIVMSSVMGVFLALWDSERTVAELSGILFPNVVMAATPSNVDIDDSVKLQDNEADVSNEVDLDGTDAIHTVESEQAESIDSDSIGGQEPLGSQPADAEANVEVDEITVNENDDAEQSDDEMSNISGIAAYVKAGQEDELVSFDNNMVTTAVYADPNAHYPLALTTVDESYFTDALFIGDSRMQGFGLWSGLPATFYCATGFQLYKYETTKVVQTENGKVPIFDALPYDAFTKIYIKVGLNEMGWANEEQFEELYAQVIAKLREREPRAIIYIHGLLPVTADKSATDRSHNNTNIANRNAALQEFAVAQKAYYVDAGQALAGPDGCLPAEMTGDGIHLKSQYMPIWKDYLMQHAAVIR